MDNESINNQYYQTKYDNCSFQQKLELSQGLVNQIGRILLRKGYLLRMADDSNPFIFPDHQEEIRGLDVFCAKSGISFFIDAKDYARLGKYEATGIPLKIYYRYKVIQKRTGIKAAVLFVDNAESEKGKYPYTSLFKENNIYYPYGNFLNNFIKTNNQNIGHKKETKKGKIYFTEQIIWDYNQMKSIYELF